MVDLLLFMIYCCQDENGKLAYMDFSMVHKNLHLTQVKYIILSGIMLGKGVTKSLLNVNTIYFGFE